MDKLYYSWNDLEIDCRNITREMAIDGYRPDVVIGPGRGGYPVGVMFSHYFNIPFEAFNWQTRDGKIEDSSTLKNILSKYNGTSILIVDDINDTGTTLNGICKVIEDFDKDSKNLMIKAHQDIKVCTLFNKTMSSYINVDYYARECTPDYDPWIVFPYEEWWK